MEQRVEFLAGDLLSLDQESSRLVEHILMRQDDLLRLGVALRNDPADFLVDLAADELAVPVLAADVVAEGLAPCEKTLYRNAGPLKRRAWIEGR